MAVRAQDAEVLESIVATVAVDVIELDGNHAVNWPTHGPATQLASSSLEAFREQSKLQSVARDIAICDEHLQEWSGVPSPVAVKRDRRVKM